MTRKPTILFFTWVTFRHILGGRAEALTRGFAKKGFKVVFVEPQCSILGFLRDQFRQGRSTRQFLFHKVKNIDGITVIPQFPILPFGRFKLIRFINGLFVGLCLKKILSSITHNPQLITHNSQSIGIVSLLWWYPIIKHLNNIKIYYDCIDDMTVLCKPREFRMYEKLEKKIVSISNAVFVISPEIEEHILSIDSRKQVITVPNGVDAEWFEKQAKKLSPPQDIVSIKKPIAGYIGAISLWVDTELIAYSAKQLKDWSFVIVGPVIFPGVEKVLENIPNIYLLGARPYKYIPSYIKAFDTCLIPFKANKMGDSADPIKLYEYLATGKPVVSTNTSTLRRLNEIIYIGKDKNDFVEKITLAYKQRDVNTEKRYHYALENSWDERVNNMIKYFNL